MNPSNAFDERSEKPIMILKRLREETFRNHSAIESQMPLLDPTMSLEAYYDLLSRFWGYYAPLEDRLMNRIAVYWPGKDYLWSEREKTPLLTLDLQSFGTSTALLPKCTELPQLDRPAQVLGCLYVVEGATLGGQIISKHLNTNLSLTCDSGAAFFHGYGVKTGTQWQTFRHFLTSEAEQLNQDDEIIISANATFSTLAQWLFHNKSQSLFVKTETLSHLRLKESTSIQ